MNPIHHPARRETDAPGRAPVSIVCVFNDLDVLTSCLERSVRDGLPEAPETELIPVDNREHAFSTAGAALNHGARLARHQVVAFVHQDVVLHSLPELERAADELLRAPDTGVMGAVGVDRRGQVIGRVRDRVVQIGGSAPTSRVVETLDEVLLLVRRDQVLAVPLSEDPRLAWHAYGVEYCLRVRRAGQRAVARDLVLTHNSLTTNLENLDLGHRYVRDSYPELVPIHTTCGVVRGDAGPGDPLGIGRRARGATVFLRESLRAHRAERRLPEGDGVVLADIRLLIDDAAALAGMGSIRALDVIGSHTTPTSTTGLTRFGRPYDAASVTRSEAVQAIRDREERELLLVTGLSLADLDSLTSVGGAEQVVGLSRDTGLWILVGSAASFLAPLWAGWRNRPFARSARSWSSTGGMRSVGA